MRRRLFFLALVLPFFSCTLVDPGMKSDSIEYRCKSGETVYINYRENALSLRYKSQTRHLKSVISASGAKYAGDGLVWWNKGDENTLYRLVGNDDTGSELESCREAPRRRTGTRNPRK